MTEITEVIGDLISNSIYALYENSRKGETFILNKNENVIEDEIVSYIQSLEKVDELEIREKLSLYLFMSPVEEPGRTLCRML